MRSAGVRWPPRSTPELSGDGREAALVSGLPEAERAPLTELLERLTIEVRRRTDDDGPSPLPPAEASGISVERQRWRRPSAHRGRG